MYVYLVFRGAPGLGGALQLLHGHSLGPSDQGYQLDVCNLSLSLSLSLSLFLHIYIYIYATHTMNAKLHNRSCFPQHAIFPTYVALPSISSVT